MPNQSLSRCLLILEVRLACEGAVRLTDLPFAVCRFPVSGPTAEFSAN
jgi:hypothetical protein